jgi:PleD family two-component response regulator
MPRNQSNPVRIADQRLYQAKAKGRNQIRVA